MAPQPTDQAVPQPTALDPNQKKMFDLIIKQAMGFLLKDENAKAIVAKAQAGDPKQAVAEAVTPLLTGIYGAANGANAKLSTVTLLAAGIEIIGVLAKMLEAADILTEQEIPAFCADVAKMAVAAHNERVQQKGGSDAQQPAAPTTPPTGMVGAQPEGAPA